MKVSHSIAHQRVVLLDGRARLLHLLQVGLRVAAGLARARWPAEGTRRKAVAVQLDAARAPARARLHLAAICKQAALTF